jgi:hypothetical protein
MDELQRALDAIRQLTPRDRHLIADAIGDTGHMVDDDMGDDADARRAAYRAISALVRQADQVTVAA